MSTTGLVVELLVVGSGASVWMLLLTLTVFDYVWLPASFELDPLAVLIALPLLYVLGLLIDRAADSLLSGRAQEVRKSDFPKKSDFQSARVKAAEKEAVWAMFEYGRSRMRVARGWLVNSVLIAVAGNAFVWVRLPTDAPRCQLALFGTTFAILAAVGCYLAWKDLIESEVRALKSQDR